MPPPSPVPAAQLVPADHVRSQAYSWRELIRMVVSHRRELVAANLIAMLGDTSQPEIVQASAVKFLGDVPTQAAAQAIVRAITTVSGQDHPSPKDMS